MRNPLRISRVGWSIAAVLAVLYVVLVLASLLLIGLGTTGSMQATLLGVSWNTLAGFEMGFVGIVAVSFAVAAVFVLAYGAVRRPFAHPPNMAVQPNATGRLAGPAWAIRLLIACAVLPALALIVLRELAPFMSSGGAHSTASAQGLTGQVRPVNLGSTINTAMREAEPSFTADSRTMYFNCNNGDICVSHLVGTWEQGNWSPPERLGSSINTEYEEIEPVINGAGDTLYFTSIRPEGMLNGLPFLSPLVDVAEVINRLAMSSGHVYFGGLGLDDVWMSHRVNGAWTQPQNINDVPGEPRVNSPFADHCLFFSADGNEAFWTSTRPGGFGGDDIWTSRRVGGQWTEAEDLGPQVNGPGTEHSPIPTPDGRSLYVTSDRAGGYGGEDIYVTTRGTDGTWGPLVNLGPLVNGPGDDRCAAWTSDLKIFLFDSVRNGGFGSKDIWWVPFKEVKGYPLAAASGSIASSPCYRSIGGCQAAVKPNH